MSTQTCVPILIFTGHCWIVENNNIVSSGELENKMEENGHKEHLIVKHREELFMVYFSTVVAVCGSYAFGTCVSWEIILLLLLFFKYMYVYIWWWCMQVGYSSPTQFSIMDELSLSFSQVLPSPLIINFSSMLNNLLSFVAP